MSFQVVSVSLRTADTKSACSSVPTYWFGSDVSTSCAGPPPPCVIAPGSTPSSMATIVSTTAPMPPPTIIPPLPRLSCMLPLRGPDCHRIFSLPVEMLRAHVWQEMHRGDGSVGGPRRKVDRDGSGAGAQLVEVVFAELGDLGRDHRAAVGLIGVPSIVVLVVDLGRPEGLERHDLGRDPVP